MVRIALSRRALLSTSLGFGLAACASVDGAVTMPNPRGQVEYVVRGRAGPTVMFLHGLGVGMETWRRVLDPLAAHARAMAYNRPGYGNSDWRDAPRTSRPIADEAEGA